MLISKSRWVVLSPFAHIVPRTDASLVSNVIKGVILRVITRANVDCVDTWGRRKAMILGVMEMRISMLLTRVVLKTEGKSSIFPNFR